MLIHHHLIIILDKIQCKKVPGMSRFIYNSFKQISIGLVFHIMFFCLDELQKCSISLIAS